MNAEREPIVALQAEAQRRTTELLARGNNAATSKRSRVQPTSGDPHDIVELPPEPETPRSKIVNAMVDSRSEFERRRELARSTMAAVSTQAAASLASIQERLKEPTRAAKPAASPSSDPIDRVVGALEKLQAKGRKTIAVAELLSLLRDPDAELATKKGR